MSPIFVKKTLQIGPISWKLLKTVRSAVVKVEKPWEVGPNMQKSHAQHTQNKNKQQQQQQRTVKLAIFPQ